jgi:hypothetical protein
MKYRSRLFIILITCLVLFPVVCWPAPVVISGESEASSVLEADFGLVSAENDNHGISNRLEGV